MLDGKQLILIFFIYMIVCFDKKELLLFATRRTRGAIENFTFLFMFLDNSKTFG